MLPSDDRIRLQHMRDAARKALRLAAGRHRRDLDDENDPLADALIRLVTVIGEAAKKVGPSTRSAVPAVPWPDVAGMRDRLVHHYFDVNLDILWATVEDDLPALLQSLQEALREDTGG